MTFLCLRTGPTCVSCAFHVPHLVTLQQSGSLVSGSGGRPIFPLSPKLMLMGYEYKVVSQLYLHLHHVMLNNASLYYINSVSFYPHTCVLCSTTSYPLLVLTLAGLSLSLYSISHHFTSTSPVCWHVRSDAAAAPLGLRVSLAGRQESKSAFIIFARGKLHGPKSKF